MESLFSVDHVYRTGCQVTFRIHSTLAIAKFDTPFSFTMYSCWYSWWGCMVTYNTAHVYTCSYVRWPTEIHS